MAESWNDAELEGLSLKELGEARADATKRNLYKAIQRIDGWIAARNAQTLDELLAAVKNMTGALNRFCGQVLTAGRLGDSARAKKRKGSSGN